MRAPLLSLSVLLLLSGCGILGGATPLTNLEVAGRYRFTEFTLDPTSDAVRDYRVMGNEVNDDLTMILTEGGDVRLETLRGDRVDEVKAEGSYTISGRDVRVRFDRGDADEYFLPDEVTFQGGDQRLRAEVFREGLNMERISSDYRGITRADATLKLELREIN